MSTQTVPPSTGDTAKRRGQALAGALAGVAIVVVLAVVFVVVRHDNSDKSSESAQAPASPATAAAPTEAAPSGAGPTEPPAPAQVETPAALAKEPEVTAGKGKLTKVVTKVIVPGTGPAVQKGQTVTANYKLVSYSSGQVLDSSWTRGEPFSTPIGVGSVIKGWDQAIPGQKVGSRIQLDIPDALAYPGQGDLRFVVDILAAK